MSTRAGRGAPPKTETRPLGPGFRKGGRSVGQRGIRRGGGGGWAVPPPLRSLHQRRRSLGWSLSHVLWALSCRSPWRPLVASGGSEPPAGDTVRTGGGRSGTVRVLFGRLPVRPYRFGRPDRRLGPAAVAANSLPVPFSARGEPERGQERRENGTPHVHRIREEPRGVPLPPGTCRAARGLPSGASSFSFPVPFRWPLPPARAGGGGGRRDRRVAAARGIRPGLALCEGQRCHALTENKHRACQTLKYCLFSALYFFRKMCRLCLCNTMHTSLAQKSCTCAKRIHPARPAIRRSAP